MKKIIFTAGGTGGHIFPALAVASLCKSEYDFLWIGAKGGIENKIVAEQGIPIMSVSISGLRKKGLLRLIFMPFLLLRAFSQTFMIILRERPDVIAGFGGYATFPVCFMGALLRIPVVIHEQNSVAGLTNKILSKLADKVITAFPGVLSSKKTILLGNPVRDEIANIPLPAVRYSSRNDGLNILVLGGSLGASVFNDILPEVFARVNQLKPGHIAFVTHQVGRGDKEVVINQYKKFGLTNINVVNFIDDMAMAYANADVLVCRAGASTVSEICAAGVAAIFVPYPHAVDDHQRYNAQSLVDANAAKMFIQSQLNINDLSVAISLLDRASCQHMAEVAKSLAFTESSQKIKQVISSFIA